jgi:hypothetical protein
MLEQTLWCVSTTTVDGSTPGTSNGEVNTPSSSLHPPIDGSHATPPAGVAGPVEGGEQQSRSAPSAGGVQTPTPTETMARFSSDGFVYVGALGLEAGPPSDGWSHQELKSRCVCG